MHPRRLSFRLAQTPAASAARIWRGTGLLGSLAIGLGTLGFAALALADMAPPPTPMECVDKPDGTLCVLSNGTAGQCKTGRSGRPPGKPWVFCEPDKHECDHLELGAVCHGYLGKPAHCKEFSNEEKKTWRTCQADGVDAPAADSPASATDPAPKAAKKGLLSCTAAPGTAAAGSSFAMMLWAAALWLAARRRTQAKGAARHESRNP